MENDKLKYQISADSSPYVRAFDTADKSTLRLDSSIGNLTAKLGKAGLAAGAGLAAAGVAALGAAIVDGIKSGAEWERRLLRTQQLIRATGNAAGLSTNELSDFAKGLDLATLGDRNQIMDAINALQTFKTVRGDIFKDAIRLSGDLAEVLGVNLSGQAVQLGKALEDPIAGLTALRRVGVSFTDQQKDQIKTMVEAGNVAGAQRKILQTLEEQVGGAAAAAAGGLSGKVDTLNFRWREFKEHLASSESIIHTVGGALDSLANILEKISSMDLRNLNPVFSMGNKILAAGGYKGPAIGVGQALGMANRGDILTDTYGLGQFGEFGSAKDSGPMFSPMDSGQLPEKAKEVIGLFGGKGDEYRDLWQTQADERYDILSRQYEYELELEAQHLEASKELRADFWEFDATEREEASQRSQELLDLESQKRKEVAANAVQWSKYAFKEFGKNSEAAFSAYKAIAIGETVVNTAKAAMGAYSAMAGIPYVGPALGVAAALAAIAYGAAQISAISSASPGGGSVGGGGGGAVGTYSANPDTGMPNLDPAIANDNGRGTLTVIIEGNVIGNEEYAMDLATKISELVEDKNLVLVASESKTARKIT
ncbi:MAG: phage tail length tape measure family protein [Gammaproteobacteria bacterium]